MHRNWLKILEGGPSAKNCYQFHLKVSQNRSENSKTNFCLCCIVRNPDRVLLASRISLSHYHSNRNKRLILIIFYFYKCENLKKWAPRRSQDSFWLTPLFAFLSSRVRCLFKLWIASYLAESCDTWHFCQHSPSQVAIAHSQKTGMSNRST